MRILVGLSGGLDSTYAAYLLKSQGHDVEGAVLIMGDFTNVNAAKHAAEVLGIEIKTIDCRESFRKKVIENFTEEYLNGRTPNPCALCNREIKIEELCRYAEENGFDKAVTGHYARISNENGRYCAAMGKDRKKDQSYMLWRLSQKRLSMLYTPLADMSKADIREAARKAGLSEFADLPESQEICFIPDNDHAKFISNLCGEEKKGNFVSADGKVLGQHKGITHYTVGQKKGLGIALGEQYTVVDVCAGDNTVTIVPSRNEEEYLFKASAVIKELNFQYCDPSAESLCGLAKIRYAAKPAEARATIKNGTAQITFSEPQRAITPGQSFVFYADEKIAFGGIIAE